MGLSFSVPEGVKVPSSLVNIFKELKQDLGCSIPSHGNLEKWAVQVCVDMLPLGLQLCFVAFYVLMVYCSFFQMCFSTRHLLGLYGKHLF